MKSVAAAFGSLLLVLGIASANEMEDLEELSSFHLDFEDTISAAFADGQLTPNSTRFERGGQQVEAKLADHFVPGLVGKALSTKDEETTIWIDYPADKNFNTRQGTILFWMKYDTLVTDASTSLLAFNSPGFMYLALPQDKTNQQATICFLPVEDLAHPQNNYYQVLHRTEPWKAGEWHQVCLTWSLQDVCYYEDGKLLVKGALRKPAPENMAKAFLVVLAGWSGSHHNTVVMDNLYIFPSALTEELVRSTQAK